MIHQRISILVIILVLASCGTNCVVHGQRPIENRKVNEIGNAIHELINSSVDEKFNGSILIAKDGQEIIQLHFGWTDADSLELIDTNSRFNVGSFAKEIPGVLIHDLILKGLVSHDDTVDKYLKGLPDWSQSVTINQLLFYKSGLPNINFRIVQNDSLAMEQLMGMTILPFKPGLKYNYSNWNNFILAKVLEEVVSVNFQTWVQQKYFVKLEINSSFYDSTTPGINLNMTKSFSIEFGNDETGNPNFKQFGLCYAPLYMTIGGVLKWIEFVSIKYLKDGQYGAQFYKPTTIDAQGPLGELVHREGKVQLHLHGGSTYSYGTSTYRNYENGITVIIMTNRNKGNEHQKLNDEILRILKTSGID